MILVQPKNSDEQFGNKNLMHQWDNSTYNEEGPIVFLLLGGKGGVGLFEIIFPFGVPTKFVVTPSDVPSVFCKRFVNCLQ